MTKTKTPLLEQLISRYLTTAAKLYHLNEQINALRSQITEEARESGYTDEEIRHLLKGEIH
jgi:cell division protein FtsL